MQLPLSFIYILTVLKWPRTLFLTRKFWLHVTIFLVETVPARYKFPRVAFFFCSLARIKSSTIHASISEHKFTVDFAHILKGIVITRERTKSLYPMRYDYITHNDKAPCNRGNGIQGPR